MSTEAREIQAVPENGPRGKPLSPWTYSNPELFELEYEALFLKRWQFAGHVSDVPEAGDFIAVDIGRDNIVVMRQEDNQLRAFLNVCRHRASRLLSGSGNCRRIIQCPYHGWTYRLDGSLMAIPNQQDFDDIDRADYGLHRVQVEVFHGLIFVRVKGAGDSIAHQFSHLGRFFEKYDVANYEKITGFNEEIWDVNWKVAWDNYLENYHIPVGHPGLNRLVTETGEWEELTSGVSYGVFVMKSKRSSVDQERQYQEQIHHGDHRLPDDLKGKWVQLSCSPNLGIDLYPEMLDMFQLIPITPDKTFVRASFYGHKNPTPQEKELRRLNRLINGPINTEDKEICMRVQQGLRSHGYRPGPFSSLESAVLNFHELVRRHVPVSVLDDAPARGTVAVENAKRISEP